MSSLPITLDIERRRGDTKPFAFTIKDADGADQTLTGFSFRFTCSAEKEPTDQTEEQFQIVGTSSGAGNFEFGPTVGDVDLVGTFYYDVQIVDGDGDIYTVYAGKLKFKQDITKETN